MSIFNENGFLSKPKANVETGFHPSQPHRDEDNFSSSKLVWDGRRSLPAMAREMFFWVALDVEKVLRQIVKLEVYLLLIWSSTINPPFNRPDPT
jgi:hypothetical protein